MRKNIASLLIIFVGTIFAQWIFAESEEITSQYTFLEKDCTPAFVSTELLEGQDSALYCKGYGPYRIFIYFSAFDTLLTIEHLTKKEQFVFSPAISGINSEKGVVEWRMVNGRPFAIIVRSREPLDPGFDTGKKATEFLVIRELDGFLEINKTIDVQAIKKANVKARLLSDAEYKRLSVRKRKSVR